MRLYLTTLNPTDSVTRGFLPAARALGCEVTILTDQPERYPGAETLRTDVRDARDVIDTIARHHRPEAIFSNSDHIQPETALAAAYFGLPGKDWRACLTAKNKALTRRALAAAGVEVVRSARLVPGDPPPRDLAYPVVVKPREGVASEDVVLARDGEELARAVAGIRARRPGATLVAEEYLEGELRTLETLGDGHEVHVLGGFRTTLGPLPHFVEERLDWDPVADAHVLRALGAIGAGFGACHTEYILTAAGPRVVEVNYRLIGDTCDFLMAEILGIPLHEQILRVHFGEPVPTPPRVHGHGAAVSLVADRSGAIKEGPGDVAENAGGVRLRHRALRAPGEVVELTNTNRDYLGIVRASGPDGRAVERAIDGFRARHPWVIE
ncbi:ATP-grasp domain-containing protein [Sphaerisporangium album]|uniref:ATP-grasp domain-containing protein n=1 Tax=Sphaerisporangium album TaxID=509200 RepID=A0A367FGT6_9ACTN|nr:ATP-grasp domain-containing protein [Sphaerisporangium album]RCG29514.1 ATP-grasp domain-containing protein [Sphaerisporangium album]